MVALEIRGEVCKLLFCALPLLYALVVVMSELISATLFLLELEPRVVVVFLEIVSLLMSVLEVELRFSKSGLCLFES